MSDVIAATRYTRALFELAEKEQQLEVIDQALKRFKDLTVSHPTILLLIANPTLSNEEKFRLTQNLFAGGVPELLSRFFRLLIQKKRFALLPSIQSLFHEALEKKQGLRKVEVVSAVPFSEGLMKKIGDVLKKKLRAEIRLRPVIDGTLLGGFVLRFDGKEIDCSFRNRIHEIQQKLFSSLEKGIF